MTSDTLSQGQCGLLQLPALALQRVISRVEARQLAFLCCTCRELGKTCSEPWLWKDLTSQRWQNQQTELWKEHLESSNYKALYGAKDKVSYLLQCLMLESYVNIIFKKTCSCPQPHLNTLEMLIFPQPATVQIDKQVEALADQIQGAATPVDLTLQLYRLGQDAFVSLSLKELCEKMTVERYRPGLYLI